MIIFNTDQHNQEDPEGDIATLTQVKTQKPAMYKVVLLNDDYTPMDFVVSILKTYFNKSIEEATDIMLDIHHKGSGICGIFSYEIAETKAMQVMNTAQKNQHPLQCTIEKE